MNDANLHPIAASVLDALTDNEEGVPFFSPSLQGLRSQLDAMPVIERGRAVHDLADLVAHLLKDTRMVNCGNELGTVLSKPEYIAACEQYLTGLYREDRERTAAGAQSFERFRGGEDQSSDVRSEPRHELLQRLPVRG